MATAVLPTALPLLNDRLTMEEYLRTPYHPDVDFVDDHIEERNMGEGKHSLLQIAIGSWFFARRKEWGIRVGSEYRTRVSASSVRIPDVLICDAGAIEPVRTTPPLLCIEILSPEDRLHRVIQRLQDYVSMGVPNLWLLDPIDRTAFTFSAQGLLPVDGNRIAIPSSPIFLDLDEVFSALDD